MDEQGTFHLHWTQLTYELYHPSDTANTEQEDLIARLTTQNASQNASFRTILLFLPIAAAVPYLSLLFQPRNSIVALLAITSLASTAFLLHRLPPDVTGIAVLDSWARSRDAAAVATTTTQQQARRLRLAVGGDESPLETYLPYLNMGLVLILALMSLVTGKGEGSFAWVGMGNLPAVVYAVVLAAKVVMGGVDPERELSGLKYGYRGA